MASTTDNTSSSKKPVVNFSRPRQTRSDSTANNSRPTTSSTSTTSSSPPSRANNDSNVRQISSAFHQNTNEPPLPSEPCFSTDSLSSQVRPAAPQQPQPPPPPPPRQNPSREHSNSTTGEHSTSTTSTTNTTTTTSSTKPTDLSSTPPSSSFSSSSSSSSNSNKDNSDSPPRPLLKSILKSTTISQHCERCDSGEEDARSHHTVSDDSNPDAAAAGFYIEGKWSSSDADTSQLSEREVERLERKGINPSLWCEMQQARGGGGGGGGGGRAGAGGGKKGFVAALGVGKLTGNAYV